MSADVTCICGGSGLIEGQGRIITCPSCDGGGLKPIGDEEGERCGRDGCLGVIEYLPDDSRDGGCCCHLGHPPCGYCTSTMPECTECCWRMVA